MTKLSSSLETCNSRDRLQAIITALSSKMHVGMTTCLCWKSESDPHPKPRRARLLGYRSCLPHRSRIRSSYGGAEKTRTRAEPSDEDALRGVRMTSFGTSQVCQCRLHCNEAVRWANTNRSLLSTPLARKRGEALTQVLFGEAKYACCNVTQQSALHTSELHLRFKGSGAFACETGTLFPVIARCECSICLRSNDSGSQVALVRRLQPLRRRVERKPLPVAARQNASRD
eukprot:2592815-Rhodomonas_salina.1